MQAENKFNKSTKQRQVILSELRKLDTHPTAEELFEIVKKQYPKIGLATLYRNLEYFLRVGAIVAIEGKSKRYDGRISEHHHVRCLMCGEIDDISFPAMVQKEISCKLGRDLEVVGLEINVVCEECNKKHNFNKGVAND